MPKIENDPVPAEPFVDDPDYWQAIAALVLAALRRHDAGEPKQGDVQHTALVAHLRAEEARLRDQVKARVEVTRKSGRKLAIEQVRHRFDLDCVETATLKLLVAFTLDKEACSDAGRIYGPSVNELLLIMGLGVAERVRRLKSFSPEGRLRKHRLIHLEPGCESRLPSATLGAWCYVTEPALEILVGLRPVGDLQG